MHCQSLATLVPDTDIILVMLVGPLAIYIYIFMRYISEEEDYTICN
jgi:hypothetical protein